MQTRKNMILSMALAFSSLCAWAVEPYITLEFSNGKKASFAFSAAPIIKATDDGLTISSANSATEAYLIADVLQFYFEEGPDYTAVETVVSAQHPLFKYANSVVEVIGMKADERLIVSNVSGIIVGATRANSEGFARVDLSSVQAGVYIVSTGSGVSFKLIKK